MLHLLGPGLPQRSKFSEVIREVVEGVPLNFVMFHLALNVQSCVVSNPVRWARTSRYHSRTLLLLQIGCSEKVCTASAFALRCRKNRDPWAKTCTEAFQSKLNLAASTLYRDCTYA